MRSALLKLLILCFATGLVSCSSFYTRHYTKGLFYEGLSRKTRPGSHSGNQPIATQKAAEDSTHIPASKAREEEKIVLQKTTAQGAIPETRISSASESVVSPHSIRSSPVMRKALKPVDKRIRATQSGDSAIAKAAFYILALVLCIGILALAIYFLPSIMIPAAAASAFATILLIGAIVLVCVFAFLIYTLINLIIDLFKRRKAPETEEF